MIFPKCVGCGYCCWLAPCVLCRTRHGLVKRCPELFWDGSKYRCKLADNYKEELAIGCGCCSNLNTWRQDVKRRE
jgi:hypothetical protein